MVWIRLFIQLLTCWWFGSGCSYNFLPFDGLDQVVYTTSYLLMVWIRLFIHLLTCCWSWSGCWYNFLAVHGLDQVFHTTSYLLMVWFRLLIQLLAKLTEKLLFWMMAVYFIHFLPTKIPEADSFRDQNIDIILKILISLLLTPKQISISENRFKKRIQNKSQVSHNKYLSLDKKKKINKSTIWSKLIAYLKLVKLSWVDIIDFDI